MHVQVKRGEDVGHLILMNCLNKRRFPWPPPNMSEPELAKKVWRIQVTLLGELGELHGEDLDSSNDEYDGDLVGCFL